MSRKTHHRKRRWYHASPVRFSRGDVIRANDTVFLTGSPQPHYTIVGSAVRFNWTVYEVEPLGKLYFGEWNEVVCPNGAEVIRTVGSARGLSRNGRRTSRVRECYRSHYGRRASKHGLLLGGYN